MVLNLAQDCLTPVSGMSPNNLPVLEDRGQVLSGFLSQRTQFFFFFFLNLFEFELCCLEKENVSIT